MNFLLLFAEQLASKSPLKIALVTLSRSTSSASYSDAISISSSSSSSFLNKMLPAFQMPRGNMIHRISLTGEIVESFPHDQIFATAEAAKDDQHQAPITSEEPTLVPIVEETREVSKDTEAVVTQIEVDGNLNIYPIPDPASVFEANKLNPTSEVPPTLVALQAFPSETVTYSFTSVSHRKIMLEPFIPIELGC